jgi:hypothetical protein
MRHVILPTQQGTAPSKSLLYIGSYRDGVYTRIPKGTNGIVYALAFDSSGNLYAGGAFTTAGGTTVNYVAKWDGSSWSALGSGTVGTNGIVYALAFDSSGNLYAGGAFTTAGGTTVNRVAKWDGSSWSALGSGTVGTDGIVYALAFDSSGNLYAGGAFTTAGGTTVNRVAKWDGSSWSALGSGTVGTDGIVYVLHAEGTFEGTDIYIGGEFTTVYELDGAVTVPIVVNRIVKWNGSSWTKLGDGLGMRAAFGSTPSSDGIVYGIESDGTYIYAVGTFFYISGSKGSIGGVARWDGLNWEPISGTGSGFIASTIYSIDFVENLYFGGAFTQCVTCSYPRPTTKVGVFVNSSYVFVRETKNALSSAEPNVVQIDLDANTGEELISEILDNELGVLIFPDLDKAFAKLNEVINKYGSVVTNFASSGGIVIGCGSLVTLRFFEAIGLCAISSINSSTTGGRTLSVVPYHPLTNGVRTMSSSTSWAYSYCVLDDAAIADDVVTWSGYSVASVRPYGNGYVILSGIRFDEWTGDAARLLGNAAHYRGGTFGDSVTITNATRLAKFDGSKFHAVGAGVNNDVRAVEKRDDALYFGGAFTAYL